MREVVGWIALALAAWIGLSNFYQSFVRGPLYWILGRQVPEDFGAPLLGSVLQLVALAGLWTVPFGWLIVLALAVVDTGGLPWFLVILMLHPDMFKK